MLRNVGDGSELDHPENISCAYYFCHSVVVLKESRCAYVVLVMAVYWITEAIPISATAFLPVILMPVLGVLSASKVTKAYISVSSRSQCQLSLRSAEPTSV